MRAEQQALDERMIAINERIETNLVAVLAVLTDTRALPPAASAERVDRALEAEMIENGAAPEKPAADTEGDNTAEIDAESEHGATDDGLLVRTARWLERRLRGRG